MSWFEVLLCPYQPHAFIVKADTAKEGVEKTVKWAWKEYPGLFVNDSDTLTLQDSGYPLVSEIGAWQ